MREKAAWLTVPVLSKGKFGQLIGNVGVNNDVAWGRKHWRAIEDNYAKAPYLNQYRASFEELYSKKWDKLVDLNTALIRLITGLLGINKTQFLMASELGVSGKSTDLLIDICKVIGADEYLSGTGGSLVYLDKEQFKAGGINLKYSDFKHPVYPQSFGEFIPNLSVIDLLFNMGLDSRLIIKGNKK